VLSLDWLPLELYGSWERSILSIYGIFCEILLCSHQGLANMYDRS
jgi:hypothetical protein